MASLNEPKSMIKEGASYTYSIHISLPNHELDWPRMSIFLFDMYQMEEVLKIIFSSIWSVAAFPFSANRIVLHVALFVEGLRVPWAE